MVYLWNGGALMYWELIFFSLSKSMAMIRYKWVVEVESELLRNE